MTTFAVASDGLPSFDAADQPLYQTPHGFVIFSSVIEKMVAKQFDLYDSLHTQTIDRS
jgi:hypothetical protein